MSARSIIGLKVYKKLAHRAGKMPTWEYASKLLLEERIKQGRSCITNG